MKYATRLLTLLFGVLGLLSMNVSAQGSPPDHRFAARVNVLGVLSLDAIGELEYSFSDQLGLFVGGGVAAPVVDLGQGDWFKGSFNAKSGGAYLGMRIGLPLGSIKGVSLKPAVAYTKYGKVDGGGDGIVVPGIPQTIVYPSQMVVVFVSVAYAHSIGSRFFVEPVIGVGPNFMQTTAKGDRFTYSGFAGPVQLNLGMRF
jgi:hypothetical protein